MRWHSPLLAATLKRTFIEMTLLALGLFIVGAWLVVQNVGALLTVDIVCMLFYIFRLRLHRPLRWRTILKDSLSVVALSLLICVYETIVALWLFYGFGVEPIAVGRENGPLLYILMPIANLIGYVFFRCVIRVWLWWNSVRRKHLLWALTHSHMMLIVLVTGAIMLLIDIVSIYASSSRGFNTLLIVPLTFLLLIPASAALVIILPPFTLFSYFVIRRTTNRLKALMMATSALRSGNYSVRVEVTGEDEVAQLQRDFNDMAIDLQRTMHALQDERDRVSRLLQERRELIANVSHELRTPVATMRGYLETTLMHWDEVTPTALQQDMQVMENEVIHLQGRVDDLFMLSRADVGALRMQCEPTNIATLIEEIVNTRAPLAWRASRIEVVATIARALPCALVDARRLQQAIQNLLHNGLRHTSPGGIVAIEAAMDGRMIKVQVKDTGEGIAPEDLEHIWERYYQVARSRSHGVGAGLGLALVKDWVEEMDGHVAVESVVGQGSCFTLWLPVARD
jgi:signal transduction histidine kinase